jgi:hypothetical protein
MDTVEATLEHALVTMVGGARSDVSTSQILVHLERAYDVQPYKVQVCRYKWGGFLLRFHAGAVADQVIHSVHPLPGRGVGSLFLAMASVVLSPLRRPNIPEHA